MDTITPLDQAARERIWHEESYRIEARQQLEKSTIGKKHARIWEILNSSIGIWFLSTCVVGSITFAYSLWQQEQQALNKSHQKGIETARNNATLVTVLLPYLASDEKKKWGMAMEIIKYMKVNGELPGELEYALEGIVDKSDTSVKSAGDRDKIERAIAIIDISKGNQTTSTDADLSLPARTYIQIATENQRPVAKALESILNTGGFITPGIENVGAYAQIPPIMEIRYYRDQDKSEAQSLIVLIKQHHTEWQIKNTPVKAQGTARPRHYEIWFGYNL